MLGYHRSAPAATLHDEAAPWRPNRSLWLPANGLHQAPELLSRTISTLELHPIAQSVAPLFRQRLNGAFFGRLGM